MSAASDIREVCSLVGIDTLCPKCHTNEIVVHRTRAGCHQRSTGAWSWYAVCASCCVEVVGSVWAIRQLLTAHRRKYYRSDALGIEFDAQVVRYDRDEGIPELDLKLARRGKQ